MGITLVVRIFGFIDKGTRLQMGNQQTITSVEVVFLMLNTVGFVLQTRLLKNSARN